MRFSVSKTGSCFENEKKLFLTVHLPHPAVIIRITILFTLPFIQREKGSVIFYGRKSISQTQKSIKSKEHL